jgi:hypothetical protein
MSFDLPHNATDIQFFNARSAVKTQYQHRPPGFQSVVATVFPHGAMRSEVSIAKAKIRELTSMPENWDGYGATRISSETQQNALSALDVLLRSAPVPDIVPNANGTIAFEWESSQGIGHFEIGKTKFSFYVKTRSGSPALADGLADQIGDDIGPLVASLLFPVQHLANTMTKISIAGHVRSAY